MASINARTESLAGVKAQTNKVKRTKLDGLDFIKDNIMPFVLAL